MAEKKKLTKREKVVIGCSIGVVVAVGVIFTVFVKNLNCYNGAIPKDSIGVLGTVSSSLKPLRRAVSVPTKGAVSVLGNENVVSSFNNNSVGRDFVVNHIKKIDRQGPPSWIVECLENGKRYLSQAEAAKDLGIRPDNISRHLNGLQEHAEGYHLKRIGQAVATSTKYDLAV